MLKATTKENNTMLHLMTRSISPDVLIDILTPYAIPAMSISQFEALDNGMRKAEVFNALASFCFGFCCS